MTRKQIVQLIENEKLIVIVRSDSQEDAGAKLDNLIRAGVVVLEVTSNTPGYLQEIKRIKESYPAVLIGAGTVTDIDIAKAAINAGAHFLVTPNTDIDIITTAHKYNVPVAMGALTPSEVVVASNSGADFVKLFPAGAFGIDYFKAVRAPLNKVSFFVVGGINLQNVVQWMEAGAIGVGIGTSITKGTEGDDEGLLKIRIDEFKAKLTKN